MKRAMIPETFERAARRAAGRCGRHALLGVLGISLALPLASGTSALERQRPEATGHPRIVNGVITHDFPAVGALLRGDFPDWSQHVLITPDNAAMFCSGTLIGCRTFLTAGHCTKTFFPPGELEADEAWVYLPHAGHFTVASIARHPDYALAGPGVPINDVAVLKLGQRVNGIAPMMINLTDPNPFVPAAGTIVGFGNTGGVGAVDKGIKRVGRVETATCLANLSPDPDAQLVCWDFLDPIGPPGEDSNACVGDSGGPLILDLGDGPVVAGVTSSGTSASCLPPDHSFDANIYTYSDFILDELGTDDTTACGGLPPVGNPAVEVLGFDGRLDDDTPSVSHTVDVGAGMNRVLFTLNALETVRRDAPERTFDANMVVTTPSGFVCGPYAANVFGACAFNQPEPGTYSVRVERSIGAGDYQVTATVFGGAPLCGNGELDFDEQCDDGNVADGDCCAANCGLEPFGSPCGEGDSCNGLGGCVASLCSGDCDENGAVAIHELVTLVNIGLDKRSLAACPLGDADGDGRITIHEVMAAVFYGLEGCPAEPRPCGGIAGLTCDFDEVCDLRDPTCQIADLAGVCREFFFRCPEDNRPVCGCDGVTYAKDCLRLHQNVALAHTGACE